MDYDFSGWATRNNIQCSDGRTIMKDAFIQNDGQKVPLVWNHDHNRPDNVLGHAMLENRDEGVYAYCKFNDTEAGKLGRTLVISGDVDQLSIYANKLKSNNNKVVHGCIREVSLVLAGANPGAYIDSVIMHGDDTDAEEEAVIFNDEYISVGLEHSDKETESEEGGEDMDDNQKELGEKTVEEVFNTLTEDQKNVVYAIVGEALKHSDEEEAEVEADTEENNDGENNEETVTETEEDSENNENNENIEEKEGDENMKHNVFDKDTKDDTLMHSDIVASAIADAKRYGSMKESFLEHAAINNIDDMEILFPDAHALNYEPKMIEEDNSWVGEVMSAVKHSPFSRVKATFGRLTEPEARAKGYIKGNKKTNIKMAVLNRVTTPTTVYIKNEIDRDDVIDITNFDVVAWQKKEMRKQLNKELARAILLGDKRDPSDVNKINELNIRPVLNDDEMYTINYVITEGVDYKITGDSYSENDSLMKGVVRGALKARRNYKGSGNATFFTTEGVLNDLLLIEDQNGRVIYDSIDKLATAMRVKKITTVPEMEAHEDIFGIIVNLNDYTAGADKGGSVSMFDDFDIDYNQMKYLMETRMSGALTVPYSAIVLRKTAKSDEAEG
jgi:hypothetical protein